jgi:hypothetical protein
MVLNKKVTVSTGGIHGNCWYASELIRKGELVWEADESDSNPAYLRTRAEVEAWPAEKQRDFWELGSLSNFAYFAVYIAGFLSLHLALLFSVHITLHNAQSHHNPHWSTLSLHCASSQLHASSFFFSFRSFSHARAHCVLPAYQVGPDLYCGFPDGTDGLPAELVAQNHINHSCDSNTGYEGYTRLVALRDIQLNEEITYDYALSESEQWLDIHCRCGSAKCRDHVTGDDWKLESVQKQYAGYFLPHIQVLIDGSNERPTILEEIKKKEAKQ